MGYLINRFNDCDNIKLILPYQVLILRGGNSTLIKISLPNLLYK